MKKLVLATAVAALSMTAAQAKPTVYGKAFLTLDYTKTQGGNSLVELNDNGSRIGLKGSEKISHDTKALYQLEYRIRPEQGKASSTSQFDPRDTYIGLSNNAAGTLLAGRLTAIDSQVNYSTVAGGMYDNMLAFFDAPRANNALAYLTPEMSGLQAGLMYVMDENNPNQDYRADPSLPYTSVAGLMVKYETDAFNAGASYITAYNNDVKITRLSGSLPLMTGFTVGGLYQMTDTPGSNDENAFQLSAKYGMDATTVYGQFDRVTDRAGVANADRSRYVLGAKQNLAKSTILHGYIGYTDPRGGNNNELGLGAGIEKKF